MRCDIVIRQGRVRGRCLMAIELAKHELEDVARVFLVPWPLQWVVVVVGGGGGIICRRGG